MRELKPCPFCGDPTHQQVDVGAVSGLEIAGWIKPEHPDAIVPIFVRSRDQAWMESIFTLPVVLQSDAEAKIRDLLERIEALMSERSNLISTKRQQINALVKERDEALKALGSLENA